VKSTLMAAALGEEAGVREWRKGNENGRATSDAPLNARRREARRQQSRRHSATVPLQRGQATTRSL
jgi:hypothetical protein